MISEGDFLSLLLTPLMQDRYRLNIIILLGFLLDLILLWFKPRKLKCQVSHFISFYLEQTLRHLTYFFDLITNFRSDLRYLDSP